MDIKSGWKTSEFWVMIVTAFAPLVGLPVEPMAVLAAALYTVARTAMKIFGSPDAEEYEIIEVEDDE